MKALFLDFLEKHERDIAWFLLASVGWGLAFWYMPADLRSVIFSDAILLVQSTAVVFFIGLLFRWIGVLSWILLGMALSLLFGEHTRHSLIEGDAMERITTFSMVLGLLMAHGCPSWAAIRGFFARFKSPSVNR